MKWRRRFAPPSWDRLDHRHCMYQRKYISFAAREIYSCVFEVFEIQSIILLGFVMSSFQLEIKMCCLLKVCVKKVCSLRLANAIKACSGSWFRQQPSNPPSHNFDCRIHFLPHLWQERRAGYIYPGKKRRLFTRAKVAHLIYFARHSTQKLMYTCPEREFYMFYNNIIIFR